MSADYRTLNHSKFLLIYPIISVVKYRKKLKQETTVRIWEEQGQAWQFIPSALKTEGFSCHHFYKRIEKCSSP